jgi:hypothetical protein
MKIPRMFLPFNSLSLIIKRATRRNKIAGELLVLVDYVLYFSCQQEPDNHF